MKFILKYQTSFRPSLFKNQKLIICKKIILFFATINELLKKKHSRTFFLEGVKITSIPLKTKKKSIIINRAPYRYKLAKNNLVLMSYFFTIHLAVTLKKITQLQPDQKESFKVIIKQLKSFLTSCDTSIAKLKTITVTIDAQLNNFYL
jgi:hypothetical protein